MSNLQSSRAQFEYEWRRLRNSIQSELGIARRWRWGWAATLTSLAVGVTVGATLNRRRKKGRTTKA